MKPIRDKAKKVASLEALPIKIIEIISVLFDNFKIMFPNYVYWT